MRRHYRNHLTARRRDVVARMVQPPPVSSVSQGAPSTSMHPHLPMPPHAQDAPDVSMRSGSLATSMSMSISPSISRSSSYSPSPTSSRSPSPIPSPVSAVTSPFPPTPRSLPSTSFRTASPARYHFQPYYQHHHQSQHQSHSQPPPAAAYAAPMAKQPSMSSVRTERGADPGADADEVMRAPSPPWSTDEYDADELDAPVAAAAPESYVRGGDSQRATHPHLHSHRVSNERGQPAYLWSDRERELRPRAESSPDMRRARPYPYPYPHSSSYPHTSSPARQPSGLPAEAREDSESEDEESDDRRVQTQGQCDVPGCECGAAGSGAKGVGTPRLRPAFRDAPQPHSVPLSGWTVLEDASEDA
ncbi:hypothetical protein C8Q77DRAFT_369010 [Trametes polyzona]|nr:hypothetical protein C8Q77DRAFT_369010 [Trametes polyzona]